jgi:hypothetical protein
MVGKVIAVCIPSIALVVLAACAAPAGGGPAQVAVPPAHAAGQGVPIFPVSAAGGHDTGSGMLAPAARRGAGSERRPATGAGRPRAPSDHAGHGMSDSGAAAQHDHGAHAHPQ